MPTLQTLEIPKDSDVHKRIVEELESRIRLSEKSVNSQKEKWIKAEKLVQAYIPESEADSKRSNARDEEGTPAYTTVSIPYAYALLLAAHTYWSNVFLSRAPIHQYMGRHGEPEQKTQALEALIDYQVEVGQMVGPYFLWLYDAGKYGLGILGTYWERDIRQVSELKTGEDGKQTYNTQKFLTYEGSKVYNISPFDFYPDPRVPVKLFQKGEFCGVLRRISWNEIQRKKTLGYYTNVDEVKKATHFRRSVDEGHIDRPEKVDQPSDVGSRSAKTNKPAWIEAFEIYVELVPKDWGINGNEFPEKWVFTVTADFTIILSAAPFNVLHAQYPFDVLEPEVEAYGQWTRGIPETIEPIKNTIDWLVNSHFYNVRSIADGRFIADPTAVDLSDLEEGTPGFIAKLKPGAFGRKVGDVFQQLNAVDPTQNHFTDVQNMLAIGERIFGISDQMLGVLTGSGRKTATEIRTSTGFGASRLKTMTEYMSGQGFSPHSQKLVQLTQQFYTKEQQFRVAGDLMMLSSDPFLTVNPEMIAGAYNFVSVDGTLPVDRFAQATLWKDLLAQMSRVPQVMMRYDLARIFSWVASLGGLKNIRQFELQVGSPEALEAQAQAGNLVQMPGGKQGGGGAPQTNATGAFTPTAAG